jgi:hypothetical protein
MIPRLRRDGSRPETKSTPSFLAVAEFVLEISVRLAGV